MPIFYRNSGKYSQTSPYAKISGTWKPIKESWAKVSGAWKKQFVAGGVIDAEAVPISNSYFDSTVFDIVDYDGGVLVSGNFLKYNAKPADSLVKLNSDGTRDESFARHSYNGSVNKIAVATVGGQSKIYIGGTFTAISGLSYGRFARLNSNGALDIDFRTNLGSGFNGAVETVAVDSSNGKIYVGGSFTSFNGTTVNRIARLNSDGTLDTTFLSGTGFDNTVRVVLPLSGSWAGTIIVGGSFTTYKGDTANYIARLNSDGSFYSAFAAFNGSVLDIKDIGSGNLIVVGGFTTYAGNSFSRLIQLNPFGDILNSTFNINVSNGTAANSAIYSVALTSDSGFIIAGEFLSYNGTSASYVAKLSSSGVFDTSFNTNAGVGFGGGTYADIVLVRPDGTVLVGGNFSTFNNYPYSKLVSLSSNGTINTSFANGVSKGAYGGSIRAIARQSDGKILLGGFFTNYSGTPVSRIVRLNADYTVDTSFTTDAFNAGILDIAVQPDGKILVGGQFTSPKNRLVRLNSDGTRDTTFDTNLGTGLNNSVSAIVVQPDGKILVGGFFTNINGVTTGTFTRLNSNGTLDTSFNTNISAYRANASVSAIKLLANGDIAIGGGFTAVGTIPSYSFAVIESSGFLKETANPGFNSDVLTIDTDLDGNYIVGGYFTTYKSVAAYGIAKLDKTTLNRITSFNIGFSTSVTKIKVQPTGKILVGGFFSATYYGTGFTAESTGTLARLNADGSLDVSFRNNLGTGGINNVVFAISEEDELFRVLIGGEFSGITKGSTVYNYNALVKIGADLSN